MSCLQSVSVKRKEEREEGSNLDEISVFFFFFVFQTSKRERGMPERWGRSFLVPLTLEANKSQKSSDAPIEQQAPHTRHHSADISFQQGNDEKPAFFPVSNPIERWAKHTFMCQSPIQLSQLQ